MFYNLRARSHTNWAVHSQMMARKIEMERGHTILVYKKIGTLIFTYVKSRFLMMQLI